MVDVSVGVEVDGGSFGHKAWRW